MQKNELKKEVISFIKQRVKDSFFPEERVALSKGLKLMNLSLGKLIELQLNGFDDK